MTRSPSKIAIIAAILLLSGGQTLGQDRPILRSHLSNPSPRQSPAPTFRAGAGQAPRVDRVQLAVADSGGAHCPRRATMTVWVHTENPGIVRFVIRNNGGGKTGVLSANAVKGAAGTYMATYRRAFRITANVAVKYMVEMVGQGKISNWVPFEATCGPQPRSHASTRKADGRPPTTTHAPTRTAPTRTAPTRTAPTRTPPAPQRTPSGKSKPTADIGKPVKQCGTMISATRIAAVTRVIGKATARAGWAIEVKKHHPSTWAIWSNAVDRSSSCKFYGTWNCTVKARPCAS